MTKKIFTLLLAVAAGVGTMFAYDAKIGNLFYNLNTTNLTAEVTGPDVSWGDAYRNGTTTVSIPENITYNSKTYKVTSIGERAFYGCQKLTSITIPSSITSIGKNAFWNCYVLTSVTIPSSVTSIQRGAFGYCKALTSVNIPNRVTSIEESVFYYCSSLTSITIPSSVTSIGGSAFDHCGLTSITIPNSVTSIGGSAFWACSSLISVTIPSSVTNIGGYAFQHCTALSRVNIDDIEAWCRISFEHSYEDDFYSNPLYFAHSLYLNNTELTELVISNNITSICEAAFFNCTSLTSVTIPSSVTSIGSYAFNGCSNLTSVTIPSSVTSIGGNAFSSCSKLKTVTLGSNAIVSKPYSSSSNIKNIFGTQVTNYIIGSGVTSIGSYAFNGCSNLTSVTIPSSVTSIGSYAFDGCTKLTSVTIPNSVTSIGMSMFSRCSGLTSINVASDNPNYCSINGVLFNKDVTVLFQCPGGKSGTYNIPNSVTNIKEGSFSGCSKLTSITIPNSVTSIGSYAFNNCSSLTSATIGNSVTSIGSYAFNGCSNLTSVTIPSSVTSIGSYAFDGCTKLTSVTIPNSVTSIGSYAFNNCSSLTSATIGNSVTSIGAYAFYACSKLTKIVIPNSVINLGTNAFESCSGLVSAEIGTGITTINNYTFRSCSNLKSLIIGRNVNSIGASAFADCSNLSSVTIETNAITSKDYTASSNIANIFGSQVQEYILGRNISRIGAYAFHSCSKVKFIRYLRETPPSGPTSALDNICYSVAGGNYAPIYIPCGTLSTFRQSWWSRYYTTYAPIKYKVTCVVNSTEMGRVLSPSNECGDLVAEANEGYHFVQWNDGVTENPRHVNITKDTTFKAIFAINEYVIKWENDDGTTLELDSSVSHGTMPIYNGNTPSKSSTEKYTYTFVGWTPNVTTATNDTTYIAKFDSIINKYTIIWQNEDGSLIDQTTVEYGQIPAHANPVKQNTAEYTYTFAGWTPAVVAVTGNATYKATFSATKSKYLITFRDENGTELKSEEVEYGVMPIAPADPIKESTAQYDYTFAGWTPTITIVTQAATYTATYTSTIREYLVTFLNEDNTVISSKNYKYGETPVAPADPIKQNTAEYTYTFNGWDNVIAQVQGPQTYRATYTATKNSYTITWQNEDGSLIDQTTIEYGVVPTHAEPTKEVTEEYTYTFSGWTPVVVAVAGDATYTATFNSSVNKYSISATAINGSVNGVGTYPYGTQVKLTAVPNYGYHFTQWSDGNTNNPRTVVLTQNMTFTAEFAVDKSGTCGKNNLLQWRFADDGTLTISGSGELTENYTFGVEAPTQMQTIIIGNEVTAIGERAFYEKTTLQKLIIGSNVTSIGKYAFASINNRQLTSLVMPAELLTIGDYAFSRNTYLESIDFNAKLQNIGAYAFKDCYRVSEMTCLATVTPNVGTDALASINSYASLCVPAECLRKYQVDPNWGRFDLCELGTTSTVTENRTVTVEPTDNTAIFTWPTENNAASYSLQITKDGVVFCTLVFNSNGQLTGIAFAPGRNGAAHAPAATMSVAGMSFTVTGLDGASKYAYRLAVKDEDQKDLQAYSGEFATTGYIGEVNAGGEPEINLEGIEDIFVDVQKATKILHNGQIYILRGEKAYTVQGQEVR